MSRFFKQLCEVITVENKVVEVGGMEEVLIASFFKHETLYKFLLISK